MVARSTLDRALQVTEYALSTSHAKSIAVQETVLVRFLQVMKPSKKELYHPYIAKESKVGAYCRTLHVNTLKSSFVLEHESCVCVCVCVCV